MENDQRLTPLPIGVKTDIQPTHFDVNASGYAPSSYDAIEGKRSIWQYVNVVYKRLPIILAIAVVVTAAAAIYSYRMQSIYQATSQMTIEPRKPASTKKDASVNINFGDDRTYYNTQLKLMTNADLMRRVVISLGLHRDPSLVTSNNSGLLNGLRSLFAGGQKSAETDNSLPVISDADVAKAKDVQLSPEEKNRADILAGRFIAVPAQIAQTNIVEITVQDTDPVLAAKVADRVALLFKQEDEDRELEGAKAAYKDLTDNIEKLKTTIFEQETSLIEAMKSSGLALIKEGGNLRLGNLQTLLTQWRNSQTEVSVLQQKLQTAISAQQNGQILAVTGEDKALQDRQSQVTHLKYDLEAQLRKIEENIDVENQKKKELLAKYTEEYREVKAVSAKIKELQEQRERVKGEINSKINTEEATLKTDAEKSILTSLRAQLRAAEDKESRFRALYETEAAKANIEGQHETTLQSKQSELQQNRQLLDTYVQRQKEQELALLSEKPQNIKIQSNAVVPQEPIGPKRTRNILVALFLSLAAGVGLAFLLDYLDDSVRTSDDISRHLGLPTLALIPQHSVGEKKKLLGGKSPSTALTAGPGSPSNTALIALGDRNSPMAEAYRHLRTSLLFSSAGKPPQTILVTSSQPSEGKTTTAINTAITLAQSDADVVIVDCDLRRPRLHSHFGLDNAQGLTNYLSGDKTTEGLIRTCPDLPRLRIVTSGPIPPNPAELLSSNEMRNLLQFLSGRFKHVIIDSPPAISFTDASILATQVDGVVLVAMANKSSLHLMRQFKQRISAIGARIYGVVLNGLAPNSQDYYYYYGSGYYKYYSQPDDDSTPYMDESGK